MHQGIDRCHAGSRQKSAVSRSILCTKTYTCAARSNHVCLPLHSYCAYFLHARCQTSRDLPQNETSDTQHCDRQCRDDFGIHMKRNANEEEAGRTRFRDVCETRENYHGHRHVLRVRLVQLQQLESADSRFNKCETKQSPQVAET